MSGASRHAAHRAGLDLAGAPPAPRTTERWRSQIRQLSQGYEIADFAKQIGSAAKTVERWLRGETEPEFRSVKRIAEAFPFYPLVQQLADLGWIEDPLTPWAFAGELESPLLLMNRLWDTVNRASATRPGALDLTRELLRSCEKDGAPGRWRCRIFDVPSGERYPHIAFHGVEFQLAPGPDGALVSTWTESDWDNHNQNPLQVHRATWAARRLGNQNREEDFGDPTLPADDPGSVVPREVAWERLELQHRLRWILPLIPGQWAGVRGTLYRTLLHNRHTSTRRHIYLTRCYQERLPDPAERIPVAWLEKREMARVLLIGPPALRCDSVARILGEALGWMSWDNRLLAGRVTGRIMRGNDPERGAISQRVFQYISDVESYRHAIISLVDIDTLTDGDPADATSLTAHARAMLTAEDVFPILLLPTRQTMEAWAQRQRDMLLPYEDLWNVNRTDVSVRALVRTLEFLRTQPRTSPGGWEAFKVGVELPWWPPAPRVYMEPVIGDHLVRIAYQLAQRIVHGKVATVRREPGRAGQRCPVLQFAKDSLLYQSQQELRKDIAVNDLLVPVGRTEPY